MNPRPLPLLIAAVLAGCANQPITATDPRAPRVAHDRPGVVAVSAAPPGAQQVAIAYLAAARFTTPDTLRAAWARQERLATPDLAQRLARIAPTPADVDQARIHAGTTTGHVAELASARLGADRCLVVLASDETASHDRSTTRGRVITRVLLIAHAGRWQVAAFTVLPGQPHAQQALDHELKENKAWPPNR